MFKWLLLTLVTCAIVIGAAGALAAFWAKEPAEAFRSEINQAITASNLATQDPSRAVSDSRLHLARARAEIERLRPLAGPVVGVAQFFGETPLLGGPLRKVQALWTLADSGTGLGETLSSAADIALSSQQTGVMGEGFVAAAPELERALRTAQGQFQRVQSARAEIGPATGSIESLRPILDRWDAVAPTFDAWLPSAAGVPTSLANVLGAERPMTYLVLVQTLDDLRASGGFITSVGTIRIDRGRVSELQFEKVYAAEGIDLPSFTPVPGFSLPPPAPLQQYMGLGQWLLRDVNWWADFRATSTQAADFWSILHGERVDGVVALNERVIEAILDAMGPVTMADGREVTSKNMKEVTLSRVFGGENESEWYAAQSVFSQELAQRILEKSQHLPTERQLTLVRRLQDVARQRELLVSTFEPRSAALLDRLDADGSVQGDVDDYLYVVEQNVSYGKLSPFLRQDLDYAVTLRGDARPALVTLTVDAVNTFTPGQGWAGYPADYYIGMRWNPATRMLDKQPGYYGGFTRVFSANGNRFLGAAGFDDAAVITSERDRSAVGGYLGLSMGAYRRLQLEWSPNLKPSVAGQYRLVAQRQPGAPDHALSVRVSLPAGYSATAIDPGPASVNGSIVLWQTTLTEDREFKLSLVPPGGSTPTVP